MLLRSDLRDFESESYQALNAVTGENADFGRRFPRLTDVRATTLTGILAFAVLADDNPVKVAGLCFPQR